MYGMKKKKKQVDPNAPPRPTLLGHEKEMKLWRQQFGKLGQDNISLTVSVRMLERKIARLQSQLDAVSSFVQRRIK